VKPVFDSFTEPTTDRRKLLLGLLFCSAAGLAAWRQPDERLDYLGAEKLEDLVPKKIGRWNFVAASGLVVPPEDQLADAVYSQLLTRVYWDGRSAPIMLLVAQSASQTGFLQIHRPDFCYTASGYQITPITPHPIDVGPKTIVTSSMDANAGGPTEHVVYWTRVGNQMPGSWRQQKLAVAEQNLKGVIPDAILVRVSTVTEDGAAATKAIDEFVASMIASVPASRRSVFVA
jgi:EpsI family protein